MEESFATSVILPAALIVIMLGLGLSLTSGDFRRVATQPKAILIGLTSQLLLLPILGFAVAEGFNLAPLLAVGVMLVAACPGGPTSNLITHACRGDTALSVSLTAVSSLAILVTLPLIVAWSIVHFVGESQSVTLPVAETMAQVFVIAVLPVLVGMFIRSRAEGFARRLEVPVRRASVVLFVLILLGLILSNLELIRDNIEVLGPAILVLNIATLAVGYGLARLATLSHRQRVSVMIESGIQNSTLAIVVATTLLRQSEVSIPAGLYALVMFMTGGLLIGWYSRRPIEAEVPQAVSA